MSIQLVQQVLYNVLFALAFGSRAAANNTEFNRDLLESTPQDCTYFIQLPQPGA